MVTKSVSQEVARALFNQLKFQFEPITEESKKEIKIMSEEVSNLNTADRIVLMLTTPEDQESMYLNKVNYRVLSCIDRTDRTEKEVKEMFIKAAESIYKQWFLRRERTQKG